MPHSTPIRTDRNSGHGLLKPLFLLCAALLTTQPGCQRPNSLVRQTWPTMGTLGTVTLPESDAVRLDEAAILCQSVFETVEKSMSRYDPESEISRLNEGAGAHAIPVSSMTLDVLQAARRYGDISQGGFDVTVGPLVRLWGFSKSAAPTNLPSAERIQAARAVVGYSHLILSTHTAWLDQPGMTVDLGGIAKGYAVDVACDRLLERGIRNFMVDLGGNIRCGGGPADQGRRPWTIGVRNPFASPTEAGTPIIGTLRLTNGMAVATSGHYERFITIQGRRYAHIIDPRTGMPVQGMAGVTVVSTNAMHCDGMSTSLFVLGIARSQPVLAARPGTEAILIPDTPNDPVAWITPGLESGFVPVKEWKSRIRVLELEE